MQLITNQNEFDKIFQELLTEKVLFIDTEFSRRNTYYPILSIIQIASNNHKLIIDVLSGLNIISLKDLLLDSNIVKVFHSAYQDIEIFFHLFKTIPENVFDTQIASEIIGLDNKIGYSKLCKTLLNINVNKSMQTADWLKRPLGRDLLNYAIKDVEYLVPIYRELRKVINERNLWNAYEERRHKLLSKDNYTKCGEKIFNRMRLNTNPSIKTQLLSIIELREDCAKELNIPRNYCASDNDLIEISKTLPLTEKQLYQCEVRNKLVSNKKFRSKLLELCNILSKNTE